MPKTNRRIMTDGFRQEVLNVVLAQLLQERGVVSAPETIIKRQIDEHIRMPDVIVDYNGLTTIIEGEIDGMDAEQNALKSAWQRIDETLAYIGIAVVYPSILRSVDFPKLKETMRDADYKIAIIAESGETEFTPAKLDYLEKALADAFENLVKEDIVSKAVAKIDAAVEYFVDGLDLKSEFIDRAADILGIKELPNRKKEQEEEE
jgi:hypothetical protein